MSHQIQAPSSSSEASYGERIYEGKAKILYKTSQGTIVHYFKDSATAFNAQKKAQFEGKGAINTAFSVYFFNQLALSGIASHFLKQIDKRSFESEALTMLPIELVVRNRIAGSLAKRLQEAEGRALTPPVTEFFLKDDAKGDPLVSEDILVSIYGQNYADLEVCKKIALRVNEVLRKVYSEKSLDLIDFKLEFGKKKSGEIVLADEISPDTSRVWDSSSGEKLDKDRFRFDLGDLMEGYRKVADRLGIRVTL